MRGIYEKPESIKAIVEGRKTVTRRVIKQLGPEYEWEVIDAGEPIFMFKDGVGGCIFLSPRYQVGEVVYIKEAFEYVSLGERDPWKDRAIADGSFRRKPDGSPVTMCYKLDGYEIGADWLNPLFMPEWAARYFILIKDVRAERLQEITEEDARAEGTNPYRISKLEGGKHYKMLKTYHREFYPLIDHADEGEEIVFECPNMGFARCYHLAWEDGKSPVFRIEGREAFEYIGSLHPDYLNGFRILWNSISKAYPWESNPWVFRYEFEYKEVQ